MQSYQAFTDDELLKMVQLSDESAFNEIFRRYWKKLYAIAYNRLNSKQAAEDVVQEVLTTLWFRKEQLNILNLQHYLSASVRYCIYHEYRKQLKNSDFEASLKQQSGDQSFSLDEGLSFKLLQKTLATEIDKLPEKCQLVFQYSRELGLSNREIAQRLQLSSKTVEAHITRALRQLKNALKRTASSFFSFFL